MAERVGRRLVLHYIEVSLVAVQTTPGVELIIVGSHVIGTMVPNCRLINTTSLIWRVVDTSPTAAFTEELLWRYTR